MSLLPGVPKFIYVSVHDYNLPEFALNNGYFKGKRKAEAEILAAYPNSGLFCPHPLFLMLLESLVKTLDSM